MQGTSVWVLFLLLPPLGAHVRPPVVAKAQLIKSLFGICKLAYVLTEEEDVRIMAILLEVRTYARPAPPTFLLWKCGHTAVKETDTRFQRGLYKSKLAKTEIMTLLKEIDWQPRTGVKLESVIRHVTRHAEKVRQHSFLGYQSFELH